MTGLEIRLRVFWRLLPVALGLAGGAFGLRGAGVLTSDIDPACALPRVRLSAADPGSLYEIFATDDPVGGTWEKVLNVSGNHQHDWHDPEARARHRRFYRMERMNPRPPLAPTWNFRLVDHQGAAREILREGDKALVVLAFSDNAGLAGTWESLRPVKERFAGKPVEFWIVNPVDHRGSLKAAAEAAGVTVPVLSDPAQAVARTFDVRSAGEVVAVDPSLFEEVYRGAIADHCDVNGVTLRQEFLADAVASHLDGRPVRVSLTRGNGAAMPLASASVPKYATEVAPLLKKSCVNCHRPGDIGSFAMTNHASLATRAVSIKANLLEGQMPPWHADAPKGTFANDFSLEPAEVSRLLAWVDAGSPRGDGGDPLADDPPPAPADWPLGPPDRIVRIRTQAIPAKSVQAEVPYVYDFVASPFTSNVWLRAAVVRPGNRQVVHHALIFNASTFADLLQVQGGLGGFFAGYVPGMDQTEYPAGTGKLLKRGSFIVFQMHYTPVATAQTDVTELGLYLSRTPPPRELKTGAAYNTGFTIPPQTRDAATAAEVTFQRPVTIYEMSPHMHYRGKRMRFDVHLPDGKVETLLNVPHYDFAWQAMYRLTEPKRYPAGTRIRVTGAFDNSIWNPFNPDPTSTVTFGEQTNDEMFIGYLNYSEE